MTVLSVIGTRPEAIKMAPVIQELQKHSPAVRNIVCVTGQHREMLDPILKLFGIETDYSLEVLRPRQSLAQLTSVLLERLDHVVGTTTPHWVLAQGDTTTVLAAGLAAHYNRRRFGHIEAGLRTEDKFSPFPEELNRRLADVMADAHFAPTERARSALLREGCNPQSVYLTGNTIVDALDGVLRKSFDWNTSPLSSLAGDRRLVVVTVHRRENQGEPLLRICDALRALADRSDVQIVFPVHLNPEVHGPVYKRLSGMERVSLLEPLDYLSMVHLMKRASVILTDSGGIQEEAPSLGVPVVLLRERTERPEGVEMGCVHITGTGPERIVAETKRLLDTPARQQRPRENPFGDGRAAERIVSVLLAGVLNA